MMKYKNFFGSPEEQEIAFSKIREEFFIRRVLLVAVISDVLKERGINLCLKSGSDSRQLMFEIEKEGYKEVYGCSLNNTIDLIMYCNTKYGLQSDFIENYGNSIDALRSLEELMEVENIKSIDIPFKILVDSSSTEWLKIVFESCNEQELYNYFMKEVLEKNLSIKNSNSKPSKI